MAISTTNLLSTNDVAEILGVTPGRVRHFTTDGRLTPVERVGTYMLFDPAAVKEFAKIPRPEGRSKESQKKSVKRSCKRYR